jgi:hypothetical protein
MKKIIKEQVVSNPVTNNVVNAPADELKILQTNNILRNTGVLTNLSINPNGLTPLPIIVDGKQYFAGKKTPGGAFLVYDGTALEYVNGKWSHVKNKDGSIARVNGVDDIDLKLPKTDVLTQFGIDPSDQTLDIYNRIGNTTKILQTKYVDQNAVSSIFKLWNDMLTYYYPTDYAKRQLTPKDGKSLEPPVDKNELLTYYTNATDDINARLGLSYKGGRFPIYVDKNANPNVTFKKTVKDKAVCQENLKQYLATALAWQYNIDKTQNPTIMSYQTTIAQCSSTGAYQNDNFTGITKQELTNYIDLSKKNSPFGMLEGTLNWNNIRNILIGRRDLKPGNPYIMDRSLLSESTQFNLKNLIKESLTDLSSQKNKVLTEESNIVKLRFKIIAESKTPTTDVQKEKLFKEVISEITYLNSQGFSKELINEGFWEIIKGLFPSGDVIAQWFKEYLTKWLIENLTPEDPNGWLANIITTSIDTIKTNEIHNATDCDFLTKLLAKSTAESTVKKFSKTGGDSGEYGELLKNTIIDKLNNDDFTKSLEHGLSKIIRQTL